MLSSHYSHKCCNNLELTSTLGVKLERLSQELCRRVTNRDRACTVDIIVVRQCAELKCETKLRGKNYEAYTGFFQNRIRGYVVWFHTRILCVVDFRNVEYCHGSQAKLRSLEALSCKRISGLPSK